MSTWPQRKPKTCVLCGLGEDGSCDNVELTVRREDSCTQTEPDEVRRPATREKALTERRCTENDVALPHFHIDPSFSKLFQLTKVEHPIDTRRNGEPSEESEMKGPSGERPLLVSSRTWCSVNISGPRLNKLCDLLDELGVDQETWDKRNRTVWCFMLGDYLRTVGTTRIQRQDVKRRFDVLKRVEDILEICPDAHPEAAFDLCVTQSDAGPVEFRALKDKIRQVFRAESGRILRHLTRAEMRMLERTPLAEEAWPLQKRGMGSMAFFGSLLNL